MSATLLMALIMAVAAAVVFVVAVVILRGGRGDARRRRGEPEFERVVVGKRRKRTGNEVRPLPEDSRKHYDKNWQRVERTFVDDPGSSLE